MPMRARACTACWPMKSPSRWPRVWRWERSAAPALPARWPRPSPPPWWRPASRRLCAGLDLGLNARAALITRGLAEMTRLGLALGARVDTFMGLSGLGDLVLTATGDLSRNRQVGLLLAAGHSLQQAVDSLGHVAEGVYSARTVVQRARLLGVEMPISEAVVALLDGQLQPAEAVAALMGRGPKGEMV